MSFVKTLKTEIKFNFDENKKAWASWLFTISFIYNTVLTDSFIWAFEGIELGVLWLKFVEMLVNETSTVNSSGPN